MRKTNPNFLNGVPEMLVLQLLARREMYGYQLVKSLQEESGQQFKFGEGCVYPLLHYLEEEKLVSSRAKAVEGRSRYYYKCTAKGEKRLAELATEFEQVVAGIALLRGGSHAT